MKPQRLCPLHKLAWVRELKSTSRLCLLVVACTGAVAWLGSVDAEAETITLSAVDSGVYTEQGYGGGYTTGYTTGRIKPGDYFDPNGDEYRAYHVFNIPTEVGSSGYRTITGARFVCSTPAGVPMVPADGSVGPIRARPEPWLRPR